MSPLTDYLVRTGRLSEEQLLRVFVEQLEATPPLAAVVMHQNLLRPEEQLNVLKKQASDGLGYQQACVALGLWTDQMCTAADAAIAAARPSLTQILVSRGFLPVAEIDLIHSVVAMQRQLKATSKDEVRAEFDQLNQVLVDEYSLLFKADDYQKILDASTALPLPPSPERRQALDAILEQIQSVHRGIDFLGFKSVDGLLSATVHLLKTMVATVTDLSSDDKQTLQTALELFWQLSPSNLNMSNLPRYRAI